MNQDVIWEYYQNEGLAAFNGSLPRLRFLTRQLSPGESVLNIGVGAGQLEKLALDKGVEVWALDPSERAIESLRESYGLGNRAQTGYSQDMPFDEASFDVVVMSEVLEHLDEEVLRMTVREVRRVLKTGGRFIGTVPAREDLHANVVVCPGCQLHFHRWGHQLRFEADSLRRYLEGDFERIVVRELFFSEWYGASLPRKAASLVKKALSALGVGTYGVNRNFYFRATKT